MSYFMYKSKPSVFLYKITNVLAPGSDIVNN